MRREGRRPRILVLQIKGAGNRQWAHAVAAGYADLGFDVDIGPVSRNPFDAAAMAVENDAHALAVPPSSTTTTVVRLFEALESRGGARILVVAGDTIMTPPGDKPAGLTDVMPATFKPDVSIPDAAVLILDALELKKTFKE